MACFVDWIKKVLCLAAVFCLFSVTAFAQPLEEKAPMSLTAPSALLMEAETGTVIFEKNSDEQRPVASLTKLMTILLVLERLEEGEISLEDQVTVSPNAAAQTGSQALLDAHAVYPLKDLLKATSSDEQRIISLYQGLKDGELIDFSSMSEILFAWSKKWIKY